MTLNFLNPQPQKSSPKSSPEVEVARYDNSKYREEYVGATGFMPQNILYPHYFFPEGNEFKGLKEFLSTVEASCVQDIHIVNFKIGNGDTLVVTQYLFLLERRVLTRVPIKEIEVKLEEPPQTELFTNNQE